MSEDKMILNLDLAKYSAVGSKKIANEDAIGYFLPEKSEDLFLRGQMFLVVDGAGEKQDGEFASKLVVQTIIQEYFAMPWGGNPTVALTNAIKKANASLYRANVNKGKQAYYSLSVIGAVVQQNVLYLASLGSCAAFLFSNKTLEKLTASETDDSDSNSLSSPAQARQARLGFKENIDIAITQKQIQINDVVLLLTKSVVESLNLDDLPSIISTSAQAEACETLVKTAIFKKIEEDATAIIFKVRGIRRLLIGEEAQPSEPLHEMEAPAERQIVIKGVRYRSSRTDEELGDEDFQSVDEFSQDRDVRRPVHKRTTPPFEKPAKQPKSKFLNYAILFLFIFLVIYAAIKYIPDFLKSLSKSSSVQTMTPADTLEYLDSFPQESEEKTDISTQAALVEPDRKVLTDSLGFAESEEFKQASASLSIDIAVVDGSKKSFPLNDFTRAMKQFYSTDRLTPVNSSYRINNSAIIWQRNEQALARVAIANRVEKISSLYSQYFKLKPLSFSLDFTIVIGADFKMPQLTDNYSRSAKDENDYYVEILNGYKTAGVARQLANRLQNQRFKGHKIIVVNYRNADKLNYLQSFIKCEGSKTELAKEFAAHFKLPKSISNAPLYDIKILIGADIQL